jgi:hypothetical protein
VAMRSHRATRADTSSGSRRRLARPGTAGHRLDIVRVSSGTDGGTRLLPGRVPPHVPRRGVGTPSDWSRACARPARALRPSR